MSGGMRSLFIKNCLYNLHFTMWNVIIQITLEIIPHLISNVIAYLNLPLCSETPVIIGVIEYIKPGRLAFLNKKGLVI